jgi:hypothetical protein
MIQVDISQDGMAEKIAQQALAYVLYIALWDELPKDTPDPKTMMDIAESGYRKVQEIVEASVSDAVLTAVSQKKEGVTEPSATATMNFININEIVSEN